MWYIVEERRKGQGQVRINRRGESEGPQSTVTPKKETYIAKLPNKLNVWKLEAIISSLILAS